MLRAGFVFGAAPQTLPALPWSWLFVPHVAAYALSKELWSLATLLVYLGYLHFRALSGARHPAANAPLAVGGGLAIIVTLLWVNLAGGTSPGLHKCAIYPA